MDEVIISAFLVWSGDKAAGSQQVMERAVQSASCVCEIFTACPEDTALLSIARQTPTESPQDVS